MHFDDQNKPADLHHLRMFFIEFLHTGEQAAPFCLFASLGFDVMITAFIKLFMWLILIFGIFSVQA